VKQRPPDDLVVVVALAAFSVLLAALPVGAVPARVALGALLVLVLPGYALSAALFGPAALSRSERILLSIGLSLALAVFAGLLLNLTPVGLTPLSWAVLLFAIVVGGCAVAWRRLMISPAPDPKPFVMPSVMGPQLALFGVAVVVAVIAMWVAQLPVPQQPEQGYTFLWGLPQEDPERFRLGVQNMEAAPTDYTLRVQMGERTLHEYTLELQRSQVWEGYVQVPVTGDEDVNALLFRGDGLDAPYRQVVLRTAVRP
jgi:uncharacterized membrane protein